MRYFEVVGGLRIPVSGEEANILTRAVDSPLVNQELKPHDREVARRMVVKGVLRYDNEVKKERLVPNTDPSTERF